MQTVYIISGPPASGKTAVSETLSRKLQRSALISGDLVHHMIKSGHKHPWESTEQDDLTWKNIGKLTANFLERGFDVVIDAVAFPGRVKSFVRGFSVKGIKWKFTILTAEESVLLRRDSQRYTPMGERCSVVLHEFMKCPDCSGNVLHTDKMAPAEIVNEILNKENYDISHVWYE